MDYILYPSSEVFHDHATRILNKAHVERQRERSTLFIVSRLMWKFQNYTNKS